MMTIRDVGADNIVLDEIVPAGRPWGRVIKKDEVLRIIDLEGQQAVDFLCYDAANPGDRYNAMNTIKVQRHVRITRGTVLYSDSGAALFTVTDDTLGWHDTIYGCCSDANNFLRYAVRGEPNCYANFLEILRVFGLDRSAIVGNVNFFMQVPIKAGGEAAIASGVSPPGSFVELRADRDALAVLSNCPQMHNPSMGIARPPSGRSCAGPDDLHEGQLTPVQIHCLEREAPVTDIVFHLIPNAPKPVAPYSHVVECDGWLFVTGQLATDPDDDSLPLPEGIEAQTHKVMDNLKRALAGAGAGFEHVVCIRIFLTNFKGDYAAMNRIYQTYFANDRLPARTTIGVTHLARDGIIEIDMIAKRP